MGGKKKHSAGLGRAIVHKQKQAKTRQYEQTFLEGATTGTSCLEATNLEDFLATAELADRQFEAQRGRIQVVDRTVLSKKRSALAGMVQAAGRGVFRGKSGVINLWEQSSEHFISSQEHPFENN